MAGGIVPVLPLLLEVVDTSKASRCTSSLFIGNIAPVICNSGDALGEVDVNTVIVNQDVIHLEIRFLA
jgi:hypothetical protein